jgi:hypothetical protein
MDAHAPSRMKRIGRSMILEALKRRRQVRLAFDGTSMHPLLEPGDVIVVEAPNRTPRAGDVVLYLSGDRFVAHRVVRSARSNGAPAVTVKGDFTPGGEEVLSLERVLGLVLARERNGGSLDLRSPLMLSMGRVLARLSPWAVRSGMMLPGPVRRSIRRSALRAFRSRFCPRAESP